MPGRWSLSTWLMTWTWGSLLSSLSCGGKLNSPATCGCEGDVATSVGEEIRVGDSDLFELARL